MRALKKLLKVAKEVEPVSQARLAAAVLYKNKIVSIGTNQRKTHPSMIKFGKNPCAIYLHAEVDAINKAKRVLSKTQLKRSTLLVVRVKRDGSYGLAKPCVGCQRCIAHYEISRVKYTTGENCVFNNR